MLVSYDSRQQKSYRLNRRQSIVLVLFSFKLSFDFFCLAPQAPNHFYYPLICFSTHPSSSIDVSLFYQCDKSPRGSQEVHCSLAIVLHPIIMAYSVSQVPTLLTLSAGVGVKVLHVRILLSQSIPTTVLAYPRLRYSQSPTRRLLSRKGVKHSER